MSPVRRSRTFVGIGFALAALLITWLVTAENSPLHNYALAHGGLRRLWAVLNFIPIYSALMFTKHQSLSELIVMSVTIAMQWFVIGHLAAVLFLKNSNQATKP